MTDKIIEVLSDFNYKLHKLGFEKSHGNVV